MAQAKTLSATFNSRNEALMGSKETKAKLALGLFENLQASKPSLKSFEETALCYRDTNSIHKKIARSETYRLHILIKHWGNLPIEQVEKAAILRLRDDLLKLGRSGDTINHYFNTLSKLFQMLHDEWGLVIENLIKGIKRMVPSKGSSKRVQDKVEEALQQACSALSYPLLSSIIEVAIQSGMRRSEIMGITWSDVDIRGRRIYLHTSKNGAPRQVPLTQRALLVIESLSKHESRKIFPMSLNQLRGQFERVRDYARGRWQEVGANPFDDLRFHDLRHEELSRLSDAELNVIELSHISGHKTLGMLQRYTHPSHQAMFFKLDRN